ncbi:MAG TPA: MFS transporter, partial [Gaiellaceae bacterium]
MNPKLLLKSRRIGTLSVLSAASGMPYGWIVSGTLQVFLVALGFSRSAIGLLSGVSLPWALKFLWAPFVDRYALRWPGRRRSWMIMSQLALAATMTAIAAFAWRALAARSAGGMVAHAPLLIGLLALAFAFFSATQDIAYDAYTVEALHKDEQGPVSGLRILFYRLGMLLASAVAIYVSQWVPLPVVFLGLAGIFVLFTLLVLAAPEPDRPAEAPRSLARAVVDP